MLIWLSLMASCLCVEALLRRKPYAQSRLLLIAVFLAGMALADRAQRQAAFPFREDCQMSYEAVVTAEAADSVAWKWGEEIRRVLHGYVRSRLGYDEQFLFNRVDLVPDGKGSFLVMEVSLVDADLYLGSTPGALGNVADAISARAHW